MKKFPLINERFFIHIKFFLRIILRECKASFSLVAKQFLFLSQKDKLNLLIKIINEQRFDVKK